MGEMINFGGGVRMEMGPFTRPKTEKCAGLYYRDNQGPNYNKHVSRTTNASPSYNFSDAERYIPSTSNTRYDLNREGTKDREYERRRRDRYDQRNTY
jgi:hypothetical protein